jgi:translin
LSDIDKNLDSLIISFDSINKIREQSLTISREIIRDCSKSIRFLHRNDKKESKVFLSKAKNKIKKLKRITKGISEINYAGYVIDAEREFVEASLFFTFETAKRLEPFENFDVHPSSYVQGIGDVIGEWRRKALENLRKLDLNSAEKYLDIMEDSLEILNELDYPDAITGGLRRYADNARALIERTRADLTNAYINESLRNDLSKLSEDEL